MIDLTCGPLPFIITQQVVDMDAYEFMATVPDDADMTYMRIETKVYSDEYTTLKDFKVLLLLVLLLLLLLLLL